MEIIKKKLNELKPNPKNPRKSTTEQNENLRKSLEKFGVVEPIIWNKRSGYIVGGHFRVRELKKIGYKEVDCVVVNLTQEEEEELLIRLNANTGDWDVDLLKGWDENNLKEWGLFNNDYNSETIEKKEINLKPFKKTHILLTFDPDIFFKINQFLQKIIEIDGVEYEQSSN